jgi:yeast amino acid transporter
VALYPVGDSSGYLDANTFFQLYLAGPLLIFLYLVWKVYSWFYRPADRALFIRLKDIDIYTGMRDTQAEISGQGVSEEHRRASIQQMQDEKKSGVGGRAMALVRNIF